MGLAGQIRDFGRGAYIPVYNRILAVYYSIEVILVDYATLSNENQYTVFRFNGDTIRFGSPYSLEYYSEIKEWDHGSVAVMAKYRHDAGLIEEYIDLVPVLENLYFDADDYLSQIKEVRIQYD